MASRSLKGTCMNLVGAVGKEELRETVVADLDRQASMAMVALDDRDDLSALGGVARALQRDVDRLGAAGGEDRVVQPGRAATSTSASAVRATEGNRWLPMSK